MSIKTIDEILRTLWGILLGLIACWAIGLLASCKGTEYVIVETVKTETVHQKDTVRQTDSVKTEKETIIREGRPEDSLMLAKLGIKLKDNERLLILLQRELRETKNELFESHNRDSVRVDSVQVPVPVERKLTRWEQAKMDYGAVAFGGTLVAVVLAVIHFLRWLRRRDK